MIKKFLIVISIITFTLSYKRNPYLEKKWMDYTKKLEEIDRRSKTDPIFKNILEKHMSEYNGSPGSRQIKFNCTQQAQIQPIDSVNRIKYADLRVVGAVGDSIVAGNGIDKSSIFRVRDSIRGEAYSNGGAMDLERDVMTMPNALKKLAKILDGMGVSRGHSDPGDVAAGFNYAEWAAESRHIKEQMEYLVEKLEEKNLVDAPKLIHILVGANDLCQACNYPQDYNEDLYVTNLIDALDYLKESTTYTIVSIDTMFDVTPLPLFSDGIICDVIGSTVCNCATNEGNKPFTKEMQKKFHLKLMEMISSGRYDLTEEFTVVVQTHFQNTTPPLINGQVDKSFWSADCFHPARKAQYSFAKSLWHALQEPVGAKRGQLDWTFKGVLNCPTRENPFIYTNKNSRTYRKTGSQLNYRPKKNPERELIKKRLRNALSAKDIDVDIDMKMEHIIDRLASRVLRKSKNRKNKQIHDGHMTYIDEAIKDFEGKFGKDFIYNKKINEKKAVFKKSNDGDKKDAGISPLAIVVTVALIAFAIVGLAGMFIVAKWKKDSNRKQDTIDLTNNNNNNPAFIFNPNDL